MQARRLGALQILAAGACFGTLGFFGKRAYAVGFRPGELLSMRFLLSSALIMLFLAIRRPQDLRIEARDLAACVGLGIGGYAVFTSCYFEALAGLSASLTVLLLYLYPVLVTIGAWLAFGERIERDRWFVFPLALAGLGLLVWGDLAVRRPESLLFGLGAALFYSIYILGSSRLLRHLPPLAAVGFVQLSAGIVLSSIHLGRQGPARLLELITRGWPFVLGMSIIGSAFAMSLFLAGLRKLKSWEASILSTSEPMVGVTIGVLVLGESFSATQAIGATALLGALVAVVRPRHSRPGNPARGSYA